MVGRRLSGTCRYYKTCTSPLWKKRPAIRIVAEGETTTGRESSPDQVQVERKAYRMSSRDAFALAHFPTGADIERSIRFYETVFAGRVENRVHYGPD